MWDVGGVLLAKKLQNRETAEKELLKALHTYTDFREHSSQRSDFLIMTMLSVFTV